MDLSSPPKSIHQTSVWIRHLKDLCGFCPSTTDSQFNFLGQYAVEFGGDPGFCLQDRVKELFRVPKSSNPPLKKNQLIAAFIDFLLQILHLGENVNFPNSSDLMVELRSLVAILGDTPFQSTENQKLQTLLMEFEEVANEAGSTVHYAFFSLNPTTELIEVKLVLLLQQFHGLKSDVIDFLNLLPNILVASDTRFPIDSFFSLDSVIHELEDVSNRGENLPFDLKDLIKMFHQQLKGYQSLFRDVDSQLIKFTMNEGLEEEVLQIRQMAFEAEYLIGSFMVGDALPWYLNVRLTHIIEKIKSVGTQPQKLKKDYDVGPAAKPAQLSASGLSLHVNNDLKVDDIVPIFDKQEMDILDQLVRGTSQRQCVSILGMAGIGKTTLAQKLYNHPFVCGHFDRRLWCTASQKLEKRKLLVSLLTSLGEFGNSTILNMADGSLEECIYQSLYDRRFLIVVDDIWHSGDLDDLQRCLPDNKNGSRVLLTTRNHNVAPMGSPIHQLPLLSNDQCLQLLKKKLFHNSNPYPQLDKIGNKIVAKCHGLPLATIVLAGMLAGMDDEESALKMIDGIDEFPSVMQILNLSYENLPPYLKPCFLYFRAFQEDEKISIKKLKQCWIAEGFICKEENERAENVAEQYVKELIDRNLIIVSKKRSNGGAKFCVIHDLLHDLCLTLANKENFLSWVRSGCSIMYNQNHPRLRVNDDGDDKTNTSSVFGLHLRSLFVCHPLVKTSYLFNVKLLRALTCRGDLIGSEFLFGLRYLATDRMPPLIHRNANLEFLIVDESAVLTPEILKMLKLRYLCSPKITFGEDCETIDTNNLESLATVLIRNTKDEELLRCLSHLRTLKCEYAFLIKETADPSVDFHHLAQCESLTVKAYYVRGTTEMKFPSSINKLNLSYLFLPWEKMSVIQALPNLEVLKIGCDAFDGDTWNMGDEAFRRLRYLKMEYLDLSQWLIDSSVQFPRLQRLVLEYCYNLEAIPSEIGDIAALCGIEVIGVHRPSLVESAKRIQEEQREMGNDELKVIFRRH